MSDDPGYRLTRDDFKRAGAYLARMRALTSSWDEVRNTTKKWAVIRNVYNYVNPIILTGQRLDPYFVDWLPIFTPIERDIWHSIRLLGLPFFPQYPVGRYFVDFADPVRQVALECDGKQWHDARKDAERDAELAALGWRVIRFTGRRCFMGEENPESAHVELERLAEQYRGHYTADDDEDCA